MVQKHDKSSLFKHDSEMQCGARPPRNTDKFSRLQTIFSGRITGLKEEKFNGSGIGWPPYSPVLNSCDYFRRKYIKDKI